VSVDFVY